MGRAAPVTRAPVRRRSSAWCAVVEADTLGRVKLEPCGACGGFLPTVGETCPHCNAERALPAGRSKLGAVALVLGGSAIAFTLMACYGGPPCAEGNNCRPNTPSNPTPTESDGGAQSPVAPSGGW